MFRANTFLSGVRRYGFALREMRLEPYSSTRPGNARNSASLAVPHMGTVVLSYSNHFGIPGILNDGLVAEQSEDSWNGEAKLEDYCCYTWARPFNFNQVAYSTGRMSNDGGWFEEGIRIQLRQRGVWIDVAGACSSPRYPGPGARGETTYVFAFEDTWGSGLRIIGRPGGTARYTSISELDVFYPEAPRATCGPEKMMLQP
jgi:hypothetical protein